MHRVRSTPVVAWLALFVALGGTGYAAARVNGRDIADRSIPAGKIRSNSLTGAQVAERKLGSVPSAERLGTVTLRWNKTFATIPAGKAGQAVVFCNRDEIALGGGGAFEETFATADHTGTRYKTGTENWSAPASADTVD